MQSLQIPSIPVSFPIKFYIPIALVKLIKLEPSCVDYHVRTDIKFSRSVNFCYYTVEFLKIVAEIQRYHHGIQLMLVYEELLFL